MKFDLDRIKSIHHLCTGCQSAKSCCCAGYDIFISRKEMQRILNVFPLVASYCPHLMESGEFVNVFEEFEDGQILVDTQENELCMFAYRQKGIIRCALHSVAGDLGISPAELKPFHCLLWPMAISPEDETVVSIQENALAFPCNRPQNPDRICPAIEETLQILFRGKEVSG